MRDLIELHSSELNALATTWLSSGATSFAIWINGQLVRSWPGNTSEQNDHAISAPIHFKGKPLGELRVRGLAADIASLRLNTDAKLISSFIPLQVDRESLVRELVDTRDQLVILSELSNITNQAPNVEGLFRLLAFEIRKLISVNEVCFVLQIKENAPLVVIHPDRTLGSGELQNLLVQVKSNQEKPVVGMKSVDDSNQILLVPFNVHNAPIAALGLMRNADMQFRSSEIKLARAVADYTGSKAENLLMVQSKVDLVRLETEIELARNIQDSLLPKIVPKVETLDIQVASQPASRVGGDFYDFISHPNQSVDIIVGDVSGKGMPAALLMAMTLKVLRTQANTLERPEPNVIISRSNAELYRDFSDSVTFSTLFVSQYNPQDQWFTYANAGHSPVIYYPVGGRARMLSADAIPIGLFPTLYCEKRSLQLQTGDVLVMATDGLNETMNSTNRLFGFTRLMTLTEELAQNPAEEILGGILDAVEEFGDGHEQADDQTLIVIKCESQNPNPGSSLEYAQLENRTTNLG